VFSGNTAAATNQIVTYAVPDDQQVITQDGDFIGWRHSGAGIFPFDDGTTSTTRWKYGNAVGVGGTVTFDGSGARTYSVAAQLVTTECGVDYAVTRPTAQSSIGWDGASSRPVLPGDGDTGYWTGTCSHTQAAGNEWWRVDFDGSKIIDTVVVLNRLDCCRERLRQVEVRIGDSTVPTENQLCVTVSDSTASTGDAKIFLTCFTPLRGKYMHFLQRRADYLTLCNVKAFKKCTEAPSLIGHRVNFVSTNYPTRRLRHRNFEVWLDEVDASQLYSDDSSFIVRAGNAGGISVSFESKNYPGRFIRHSGFQLYIHPSDGSDLFKADSSFYTRVASDPTTRLGKVVSWESVNYPGRFIRHAGFRGRIDQDDGSAVFKLDSSWTMTDLTAAASLARQTVFGDNGSVSCSTYCAGITSRPWNNELPFWWGGAACVTAGKNGNIPCNQVGADPLTPGQLICVCRQSPGTPWKA